MQVDFTNRPQDVGFLFGMITLASWIALIGGKFTEGRTIPVRARRFGQFAMGAGLGLAAQVLAHWLWVEPAAAGHALFRVQLGDLNYVPAVVPDLLGYVLFFGMVAMGLDWWILTDRDRKRRFRVGPIFKVGFVALIPVLLFFSTEQHPLAIPTVVLTAAVVQVAAPWSEAAAQYAAATRPRRRWIA